MTERSVNYYLFAHIHLNSAQAEACGSIRLRIMCYNFGLGRKDETLYSANGTKRTTCPACRL